MAPENEDRLARSVRAFFSALRLVEPVVPGFVDAVGTRVDSAIQSRTRVSPPAKELLATVFVEWLNLLTGIAMPRCALFRSEDGP